MKNTLRFAVLALSLGITFGYLSTELKAENQDDSETYQVGNDQVVMDGDSISITGSPSEQAKQESAEAANKRFADQRADAIAVRQQVNSDDSAPDEQNVNVNVGSNLYGPGYIAGDLDDPLRRGGPGVARVGGVDGVRGGAFGGRPAGGGAGRRR